MKTPEFKAKMAKIIAQYSGSASSEGIPETVPDHDRVASETVRTPAEPAALDPEQAKKLPSGRVQISGAQAMRLLHWQPSPSYPPVAKKAGIGGAVRFATVIGKDGRVISDQLIFGHPLLVTAAEECIKQWVFRPMSLDGEPVEVETELQIFFHALK
jgi:outer membrane biosynthesis protein TonB